MASHSDMRIIKKIMKEYNSSMTYWDVYMSKLASARHTNVYDSHTALLDKWLWKYSNYTVSQLSEL